MPQPCQRMVPSAPVRPQGEGVIRHRDWEVLAAIVFVATSGCTWQEMPAASFGPSGKCGSKIHLITGRNRLPLSVGISAANTHDGQALVPLVSAIPPIRSRRG